MLVGPRSPRGFRLSPDLGLQTGRGCNATHQRGRRAPAEGFPSQSVPPDSAWAAWGYHRRRHSAPLWSRTRTDPCPPCAYKAEERLGRGFWRGRLGLPIACSLVLGQGVGSGGVKGFLISFMFLQTLKGKELPIEIGRKIHTTGLPERNSIPGFPGNNILQLCVIFCYPI